MMKKLIASFASPLACAIVFIFVINSAPLINAQQRATRPRRVVSKTTPKTSTNNASSRSFAVANEMRGVWQRQTSGTFAWLHALFFLDAQTGWAGGSGGVILQTTDAGASWRRTKISIEDDVRDIVFLDKENGWLVCERSLFRLKTMDESRSSLMHTTNGGQTWQPVQITNGDANARLLRLHFTDKSNGFALGETGVMFRTQDAGQTWQRVSLTTRQMLVDASFISPAQGWIITAGGYILRTTDAGETWRESRIELPQSATERPRLRAVSFINARQGWAVGTNGFIIYTANGGATWERQLAPLEANLNDVRFLNVNEGWAIGDDGTILRTTNGGRTWNIANSDTPHRLERLSIACGNEHPPTLWAIGFGGTLIKFDAHAASNAPHLKSR